MNDGYDDVTKLQRLQIDKLKNISTTVVKSDMRGRLIERGEIKKDLKPTVEFQDYKELTIDRNLSLITDVDFGGGEC